MIPLIQPEPRRNEEVNNANQNERKIKKIEIKLKKEILTKDSNLDTNFFLLPEITDYRCVICENVPNPEIAHEAICCGILFCKECLMNWITQNPKCPICKSILRNDPKYIRSIKDSNKIFYKTLKKFEIKCPYGCKWTGTWEDLENHLNICENGYRECKYKDIGCEFIDEKDKILEHEKNNDKLHLDLAMKFIKDNQNSENMEIDDNDNQVGINNSQVSINQLGFTFNNLRRNVDSPFLPLPSTLNVFH